MANPYASIVSLLTLATAWTSHAAIIAPALSLSGGIQDVRKQEQGLRSIPFSLAPLPALPPNQSHSVNDERRQIYVVPVSVADETFQVILDTGSADLWVDNSTVSSNDFQRSLLRDTGVAIELNYGLNGSYTTARGTAQLADVRLGEAGAGVLAHAQAFVNVPGAREITTYGNQGILGLGAPRQWSVVRHALSDSPWNGRSFLDNAFDQNPALDNFFIVEFGPRDRTGVVQGGISLIIFIGEIPSALAVIKDAPKLPLVTGSFWDVPSQSGGFLVNGLPLNITSSSTADLNKPVMMLDTGAFAASIPPEYLRAIYGSLPGAALMRDGYWSVPCDTKMNVSIYFGDIAYPIHPLDMTEPYDVQDGKAVCRSLILSNTDTRIPFLIGLNILRNTNLLYHYGDVADSSDEQPYVQVLSSTHADNASEEFDAMNAARLKAFIIRRISSSFFPRPDRPWDEDATSTAPQIGRKRRLSTDEHEERETTPSAKKQRAESELDPETQGDQSPTQSTKETAEVKEVTQGVREVELDEDKPASTSQIADGEASVTAVVQEAAAVPLPDSPELKPIEEPQVAEVDSVVKENGESQSSGPTQDVNPTLETESAIVDDAATSLLADDVPGLVLPTHSPEKSPSKKIKSSIPTSDTPADVPATTTKGTVTEN
ncbi:acid protease [Lenzites betulinus]|nr:acid protease [Lenzites betulinus]